ncbi:hypothetical protein ACFP81_06475 [Deinococcus lacus]|uniref:Uncharacterized protein n=1 Tax=Deinococcus lacus TaxID=392561 RepID=A0ABW1YBL4_9DEIO
MMPSTFDELTRVYQGESQRHQAAAERYTEQIQQEREQRQAQRRYRSKAREVHERWKGSQRQQQREAREYAERWWQAIRAWETRRREELVPRTALGSGGAGRMVAIVGNYGRGQATLGFTEVKTPIGWLSEAALGRAITESGCGALERARRGTGLGSLLRDTGRWVTGGADAGRAVLEIAASLGDERASKMTAKTL